MNRRIFETPEDLAHATARTICQSGAKTLGLTGGSTPKRLYEFLAESLPENMTWVLVDERYVPIDDPQSNAGMIEWTLFARGVPPSHRWLRFKTELDDPAATARAYEADWHSLAIT